MAKNPTGDQVQGATNAFPRSKVNRLPYDLINPKGVYSGIARRNAMEDGEFMPSASTEIKSKARKGKDYSND